MHVIRHTLYLLDNPVTSRDFAHVFKDFKTRPFQKMELSSISHSMSILTARDISAKRQNRIACTFLPKRDLKYRVQRLNEKKRQLQEEQRREKEAAEIRAITSKIEATQQDIHSILDSLTKGILSEFQLTEYKSRLTSLQNVEGERLETYTSQLHRMVELKQSIERTIQSTIHKQHKESIRSIQYKKKLIMDLIQQYRHDHERSIGEGIVEIQAIHWMNEVEHACFSFCEAVSKMQSKEILKQVDSLSQQCEYYHTNILSVSWQIAIENEIE